MSDFGFWLAFALVVIMFAPASCKSGDPNLAQAVVAYLEARSK